MSLLYTLYYGRAAGSIADLLEAEGKGAQGFRIKVATSDIAHLLLCI